MTLILQHPLTEDVKIVKVGFSWTVWFFGFIPVLYRGVYWHALALFLVGPIWYLSWLVYAFFINKLTAKNYLKKGYLPVEGLAWNYAKAQWNLTAYNVQTLPTNEGIELTAHVLQQKAMRLAIIIPIVSIILLGIVSAVAIPKLADARKQVQQQNMSTQSNIISEDSDEE
jgi:hypothetical protein